MNSTEGDLGLYGDLAMWWPLISPVAEYEEEARFTADLLASASIPVRDVLELGSGGGHNAAHLKSRFTMTLVDLSPEMLAVSERLNPECEHHSGDMRNVRFDRSFDAVFIHDAIAYMTSEPDLRQALATAYAHCGPGGIAVFMPDDTAETFAPGTEHGGSDAPDGSGVRYLEWSWDPDPKDTWILTEYAFVLRAANRTVATAHETHRTGIFRQQDWLEFIRAAGFQPEIVLEKTTEDRPPRDVFVGRREA